MPVYTVKGEEGKEVDVLGTTRAVGSEVELEAEAAAPLVESGVLALKVEGQG